MTAQDIIANKDSIFLCAKRFRADATNLMHQLADKYNFDVNDCGAWPIPVYKASRINKGTLTEAWTFYLHGSHCRFENLTTGQIVEVRYTEKPEFGLLGGFFFYTYMQTTEEFKTLADWFENHSNVYEAIDILVQEGTLTKMTGFQLDNYILAL